jgi:hypothetical protein
MTEHAKTADDYRREIDEANKQHDQLLTELEVPTYTDRQLQAQWVKAKSEGAITGTTGWTAGAPAEVLELLDVGAPYILETRGFAQVTGWIINGRWLARKSDQDLARQLEERREASRRYQETYVAENRDDWTRREAALPEWIAQRIRAFHENPEFEAEPMGWGYELIVCELAVMYAAMGNDILDKTTFTITDSDEIDTFASANGTSGTQHAFALALAKKHLQDTTPDGESA